MKCALPFKINYIPIKKLVLIPFTKKPDKIYRILELQYINGEHWGNGYRVLAYRNDDFVDVYDEFSICFDSNETFNTVGNGLNKHVQTRFENVVFENNNGNEYISFKFSDIENREIEFFMKENSKRRTIPMNILAPIGAGSKKPNFLPLFFLYDFNLARKKQTDIYLKIDNKNICIDNFPIPLNYQFRYFVRYSENCELFEFINSDYSELEEVELDENFVYRDSDVEYHFDKGNSLSSIRIVLVDSQIIINFTPSLNLSCRNNGKFKVIPPNNIGYVQGIFEIDVKGEKTFIKIIPSDGWISAPNSFVTKLIFSKNSIFCKWSKNYELIQEVDFEKKSVKSRWNNQNAVDSIQSGKELSK